MRLTRLTVFVIALIAAPATDIDIAVRLKAFDDAYLPFVMAFCGWHPGSQPAVNAKREALCELAKGHIDYAAYAKARKAAMKLFDLAEKTK